MNFRIRAIGIFVPLLIIVIIVAGMAVYGLNRTASLATDIDRRSASIARAGGGINIATRSIIRLDQTNTLGDNIEETAQPLVGKLDQVVALARSIDGTASSINGTAGAINGTAKGINSTAASILGIGKSINDGVAQINRNVDTTIDIVRQIRGDTLNITGQARVASKELSCIDEGLGSGPDDGHCR
jgi:methyl-accepting chemotaxis protein